LKTLIEEPDVTTGKQIKLTSYASCGG